jgi:Na+/proline symporter
MWFVAPRLRAASIGSGGITVIHLLGVDAGDRLQPLVVRSAVFILVLALLLQIAAILQFAGAMLADVGLDTTNVLLVALTMMTATVFAGGMRAASMIDTIQAVVVIAVALFLPLPALIATGGVAELQLAFTTIGPEATNWFGGKNGVAASRCADSRTPWCVSWRRRTSRRCASRVGSRQCGSRSCSRLSCSAAGARACCIRGSNIRSSRWR